jgi:hypothetical protein
MECGGMMLAIIAGETAKYIFSSLLKAASAFVFYVALKKILFTPPPLSKTVPIVY